jgi:hypothetical protein
MIGMEQFRLLNGIVDILKYQCLLQRCKQPDIIAVLCTRDSTSPGSSMHLQTRRPNRSLIMFASIQHLPIFRAQLHHPRRQPHPLTQMHHLAFNIHLRPYRRRA